MVVVTVASVAKLTVNIAQLDITLHQLALSTMSLRCSHCVGGADGSHDGRSSIDG